MKPPKSILDETFRYVPSAETDLRKTFARVRRERRQQAAKPQPVVTEFKRKERSNG